jgi:hypothetical protein
LPSVLAFVEAGGLERARQAEAERAERARRERSQLAPMASGRSESNAESELAEAALALFKYVARFWIR